MRVKSGHRSSPRLNRSYRQRSLNRIVASHGRTIKTRRVSSATAYWLLMAQPSRPISSTLRHASLGGLQTSSGQSPVLLARISEKKQELENLKQLRDLSGGLTAQMQALEEKLSTLSNGTEGTYPIDVIWIAYAEKSPL